MAGRGKPPSPPSHRIADPRLMVDPRFAHSAGLPPGSGSPSPVRWREGSLMQAPVFTDHGYDQYFPDTMPDRGGIVSSFGPSLQRTAQGGQRLGEPPMLGIDGAPPPQRSDIDFWRSGGTAPPAHRAAPSEWTAPPQSNSAQGVVQYLQPQVVRAVFGAAKGQHALHEAGEWLAAGSRSTSRSRSPDHDGSRVLKSRSAVSPPRIANPRARRGSPRRAEGSHGGIGIVMPPPRPTVPPTLRRVAAALADPHMPLSEEDADTLIQEVVSFTANSGAGPAPAISAGNVGHLTARRAASPVTALAPSRGAAYPWIDRALPQPVAKLNNSLATLSELRGRMLSHIDGTYSVDRRGVQR